MSLFLLLCLCFWCFYFVFSDQFATIQIYDLFFWQLNTLFASILTQICFRWPICYHTNLWSFSLFFFFLLSFWKVRLHASFLSLILQVGTSQLLRTWLIPPEFWNFQQPYHFYFLPRIYHHSLWLAKDFIR